MTITGKLKNNIFASSDICWESQRESRIYPDGRCSNNLSAEFPFRIHFYNGRANYQTPPNFHDYLEIFLVYQGQGILQFNDTSYEFNEGDLFLMGSHEVHNCSKCYDENTRTIELFFMPELIYNPGSNYEDCYYLLPFYNHDKHFVHRVPCGGIDQDLVFRQIAYISQELQSRNAFYKLAVKNHLKDLLLAISRYYEQSTRSVYDTKARIVKIKRLRSVLEHIKDNYQEHISLNTVSEKACMSSEYFCRFFRQATGLTLLDYIHRFRVAKAKDLLEQNAIPITNIAYEVGFENYSYFNRVFKSLTKISPRDYRNRHGKLLLDRSEKRVLSNRIFD